jgi:hypothetical protein
VVPKVVHDLLSSARIWGRREEETWPARTTDQRAEKLYVEGEANAQFQGGGTRFGEAGIDEVARESVGWL